jgi:hypothetical protein
LTERIANVIDLTIDRISLELHAAGHEHRVQPIVARAVTLLGERIVTLGDELPDPPPTAVEALSAAPLRLDLAGMGDEEATNRIADGMFEAIAPHLGGSSWPR